VRAALERLLGTGIQFPLTVTLSSGDVHSIPHPDYATVHPATGDLIIFPAKGEFLIAINPNQIVSVRAKRKAG
jgi:hypothetical protein